MKAAAGAIIALTMTTVQTNAEECRRVTTPTILAIVVHDGAWTRPVEMGKTLKVSRCGIRMYGGVYCLLDTNAKPPVYVQERDQSGREYTAFWGKSCR